MPRKTIQVGKMGESAAAAHLAARGYTIVATNWRCPFGELDIVARTADTLVFVEVKSRHTQSVDEALTGFTASKRDRVLKAIYHYLQTHDLPDDSWRFDLIGVAISMHGTPAVEHLENALDW